MFKIKKIRNTKDIIQKNNSELICCIPEYDNIFLQDFEKLNNKNNYQVSLNSNGSFSIMIYPNKNIILPLGIIFEEMQNDISIIGFNKKNILFEKNIMIGDCVLNSSNKDEVVIYLKNLDNIGREIKFGEPIVQLLIFKNLIKGD
jgi:dUTPase